MLAYFVSVPLYFLPIHIFLNSFSKCHKIPLPAPPLGSLAFLLWLLWFPLGIMPAPYIYFVVLFFVPWSLPFKSVLIPIDNFFFQLGSLLLFTCAMADTVWFPLLFLQKSKKLCLVCIFMLGSLHHLALSSFLFISFFSALTTANHT